jgi:TPR repeat protein
MAEQKGTKMALSDHPWMVGSILVFLLALVFGQAVITHQNEATEAAQIQRVADMAKAKARAVRAKLAADEKELTQTCEGKWNDSCVKPLAESGNVAAQSMFGSHLAGKDNYASAITWLEKAANQGDVGAMVGLGKIYSLGDIFGISHEGKSSTDLIDGKKAIYWYRMAADLGDKHAMDSLGGIYFDGRLVAQDFKESVKWLEKASEAGNISSAAGLGAFYLSGRTGTVDYIQAYKWDSIECLDEVRVTHTTTKVLGCQDRDSLEAKMAPADVLKAQQLTADWVKEFRK